jgi:hypothetical protein
VAEVPEQPPEPLGAAHRAVGDDEHAGPDAGAAYSLGERLGTGKGMPCTALDRRSREVFLHVQENRTRNVAREVELPPGPGLAELPAAVDEPVLRHGSSVRDACGSRRRISRITSRRNR